MDGGCVLYNDDINLPEDLKLCIWTFFTSPEIIMTILVLGTGLTLRYRVFCIMVRLLGLGKCNAYITAR